MSHDIDLRSFAPVAAADLIGTWHIAQTNFPMWLTGSKTEPRLQYSASDRPSRLEDVVHYRAGGRDKTIRGVDTQDPSNSAHFTWRGRGVLALLTSDWYVVHLDREASVMAIYFTPTLFTPAGVDIAARSATPDAAAVERARAALVAIKGLSDHVARLVSPGVQS